MAFRALPLSGSHDVPRFVIEVSGQHNGAATSYRINLDSVPVSHSDVAAAIYREMTGKELSRRRADWSVSGNRGDGRCFFAFGESTFCFSIIRVAREPLTNDVPAPLAAEPVAPADVVADVACEAFDSSFKTGMRTPGLPVREIRRKAMLAAVVAGAALLASMGAQASERATFLHNAARACGVATAIAAPSYDREYDRQWGSNTARHFAGMATAQRADVCREVLKTISGEGARLGVTRACDTDTDCERKNGRL